MLRKRLFIKETENEKWFVLLVSFMSNFELILVLVLTQENDFS